jgi:uncharacterized phage-like protein YoqJ
MKNSGFIFERSKTVCFSGHRPEKLPFQGEESHYVNRFLKSLLYKEISDSVNDGFNCFITGLSRGIDLWAGEIVLELKAREPGIALVAAYPYRGFTDKFKGYEKWVSGNISLKSDAEFFISEKYDEHCMRERNCFMVDNSSKLIAMLSDYRSGTGQTVRYAEKIGITVKLIEIDKTISLKDIDRN